MLSANIRDNLLVDEMQLDDRLNLDVQNQNRADFALILSMLSQDVTDNPLYNIDNKKDKEVDLRAKFQLSKPQKEYADLSDFDRASFITDAFASDGMAQVFLAQCIQNEPLCPYQRDLAPEVFAQLSPLKQEKIRMAKRGEAITYEKIKETGDGFGVLEEINGSKKVFSATA